MVDYVLEGPKWGATGMGSAGGVVTWAINGSVNASFLSDITAAFADWSVYANIQFQQVASTASSMIDFVFGAIDGPNNILGQTNYSYSGNGTMLSARVTMDSSEGWHLAGGHVYSTSGISFYVVALHEVGHAIGVGHYEGTTAVMNSFINPSITGLLPSDIHGIQTLYGAAATAPPPVFADKLVDSSFYFAKYADAAASGMTAKDHYNQIGWHQGKNPDAYFATDGYLAVHAEVRAAGVNPLEHYDQTGWKQGYDASAAFDTSLYLEHNADVRAAGIDPLAHFLNYGQAEGRVAFASVGKASNFTHGSFDAEFYLLSNPDVARAALGVVGDTTEFAYGHYAQFGWHEGRNPNSLFDVRGYLNTFADVRASNGDPLAHYDNYGWKEGRDPSAAFDTSSYETAYADVASSHINPLTHFLGYGIHEGRASFADGVLG
ncbi:MAG: matrixin family metalloprotease [Tardiphaga sp.]